MWAKGNRLCLLIVHHSDFRSRSADFQSAFSLIATAGSAANRRSGLSAFGAGHEVSGLRIGVQSAVRRVAFDLLRHMARVKNYMSHDKILYTEKPDVTAVATTMFLLKWADSLIVF